MRCHISKLDGLLVFLFLLLCFTSPVCGNVNPTFTVSVPMRDQMELPTDVYLPQANRDQKFPCILIRTPAGKQTYKDFFAPLAQAGYAVVIQDTRSHIDSEGKTFPYVSDGWGSLQDGYDTVEWLAKASFSNGRVGTLGFSAMGITQLLMAPTAPPALKCQYIGMAAGSLYHHAIYVGGQLMKNQVEGWLGSHAKDPSVLNHVVNSPSYNEFWQGLDCLPQAHKVSVPALFYGGWYDTFLQGTLDAFVARQENGGPGARGKQKLIVGPWTHYWPKSMQLGDFEVPDIAKGPPVDISPKSWFDHYLKGIENEIAQLPPVTYFVMGPFDGSISSGNVWRTADRWPVPSTPTPLYLSCNKKLDLQGPPYQECILSYTYDSRNPTPTIGGQNLFLESGPKDQRSIEARDDVLVFSSDPLTEDWEVTGRIVAKLFTTSDSSDTDFVVRLMDVYPDGRSILISDGICRKCVKEGASQQDSHPRELEVDLWSTSIVFAKGHAIRISVTSSNHPRFEKSMNGGQDKPTTARNTIFAGSRYPSQIILPVARRGDKSLASQP